MKKLLTIAVICCAMTGAAFGQLSPRTGSGRNINGGNTQSLAFTDNQAVMGLWTPGSAIQLTVNLTFSGYTSFGLSYWLEVPQALAPFLSITGVNYGVQFPDPNQGSPATVLFNSAAGTGGASAGYIIETRDLGGTVNDPISDPPIIAGQYLINTMTFNLDAGAAALAGQSFTMLSSSHTPRISEVTDSNFGDNNILPPGMFVITIVPEPSTLALLGIAAVGSGLVVYRRRKASR